MTDLDIITAATPGPWRAANGKGSASVACGDCAIYVNVRTCEVDECVARWQADARFIARARTAWPEARSEVERLREDLAETKESLRGALQAVRDQFPASVAVIRELHDGAIAERDALLVELGETRAEVERLRGLVADAVTWLEGNTDDFRRGQAERLRKEAGL